MYVYVVNTIFFLLNPPDWCASVWAVKNYTVLNSANFFAEILEIVIVNDYAFAVNSAEFLVVTICPNGSCVLRKDEGGDEGYGEKDKK